MSILYHTMHLLLSQFCLTPPLSMEITLEMHKHALRDGFVKKEQRKECIKPVIVTSVRCWPWIRLPYRGPSCSLPDPYDSNGGISVQYLSSCSRCPFKNIFPSHTQELPLGYKACVPDKYVNLVSYATYGTWAENHNY